MRILVTGARGFVGSHLVNELEGNGHEVIATDIDDCDLAVPDNAYDLILHHKPTYVVHLAARYGRILCRDQPHRAVTDNAAATTDIAAACAEFGIPVLYASSSEVYGDHGEDPITEASELRMPTTIYGLSKRWGEEALRLYLPPEKLCIVRANMLYGPAQLGGYGRCSLATFIQNACEGKSFCVHRGTSRSWLYIADAVRALRQLIEGAHSGIFNLANDTERLPMEEVAEMVATLAPEVARYVIDDPPEGQIRHKVYSINKLRRTIVWEPETPLAVGIAITAEAAKVHAH